MTKRTILSLVLILLVSTVVFAQNGIVTVRSNYSVRETGNRLVTVLEAKGMRIVARINHAAGAASVDMTLRPTEVVIFGNPAVGTPLMQGSQTVGIDLPQKALIWEDEAGMVWLSYNDPEYLAERHGIEGRQENFRKVAGALANFSKAATSD